MGIQVKNLTKSFEDKKILDNISFKVDDNVYNIQIVDSEYIIKCNYENINYQQVFVQNSKKKKAPTE